MDEAVFRVRDDLVGGLLEDPFDSILISFDFGQGYFSRAQGEIIKESVPFQKL